MYTQKSGKAYLENQSTFVLYILENTIRVTFVNDLNIQLSLKIYK